MLPKKAFITVDEDVSDFFSKILIEDVITDTGVSRDGFDVTILDRKVFTHFISSKSGTINDPFLSLESVFLNKLFHAKEKGA